MSEKFYDKKVAPKLAELGRLCMDNGLSLLAIVEWQADDKEDRESGRTYAPSGASWYMQVLRAASECREDDSFNIDKFMIWVMRETHGHPHTSIVMQQLGRNADGTQRKAGE